METPYKCRVGKNNRSLGVEEEIFFLETASHTISFRNGGNTQRSYESSLGATDEELISFYENYLHAMPLLKNWGSITPEEVSQIRGRCQELLDEL